VRYVAEFDGITIRTLPDGRAEVVQKGSLVSRAGYLDFSFMGGPRDEPWWSRCKGWFFSSGCEDPKKHTGWPCYQARVGPFYFRLWWPTRGVVLFYDNRTNSLDRVEWEGPE